MYNAGEKCPSIMDDESMISRKEFIKVPTSPEDQKAIVPGGDPWIVDKDTQTITFTLKTSSTTSGTVTSVNVDAQNVESIEITMETTNGVKSETYKADDMPRVYPQPVDGVTTVTLTLERDNKDEPMSVDVDIEACLKPGKNPFSITKHCQQASIQSNVVY